MDTKTDKNIQENIKTLLAEQLSKYPLMQVQDFIKLLYQRTFGGEHLVIDERRSLSYLLAEKKQIGTDITFPSYEEIGNGLCRFNLLPISHKKRSLETLFRLFMKSSALFHEDRDQNACFAEYLACLERLLVENQVSFSQDDDTMNQKNSSSLNFLTEYTCQEPHAVHHSELYRATYQPAYRIILTDFGRYFSLFEAIDDLLSRKNHVVIAIDGKCGSGKSTLASILTKVYDANVIAMDDFYLPANLRTPARLSVPGGNVHYERFEKEVLSNLCRLKDDYPLVTPVYYQVFDCHEMDYCGQKVIENKSLTIVEGSYSMEPLFQVAYDLSVFLDISEEKQKERLLARNGEEVFAKFESLWIPMEQLYFHTYKISESCSFIFTAK